MPAIFVAKETLAALDQVHAKKYVHRDIKPSNLAFGTDKDVTSIYILDFGDAVKCGKTISAEMWIDSTLDWSLDCHRKQKVTNKTDIEAWFYVLIDLAQLSVEGATDSPWKSMTSVEDVTKAKENFWKDYQNLLSEPWTVQLAENSSC